MYTKRNIVYSDAGKILRTSKFLGCYQLNERDVDDSLEEVEIDINDLHIKGRFVVSGDLMILNNKERTYGQWKANIIKWRYSIDDQMALLLNKDDSEEDMIDYNRMMAWREWASKLSSKLVSLNK